MEIIIPIILAALAVTFAMGVVYGVRLREP